MFLKFDLPLRNQNSFYLFQVMSKLDKANSKKWCAVGSSYVSLIQYQDIDDFLFSASYEQDIFFYV